MTLLNSVNLLLKYKAWANEVTFSAVMNLPKEEVLKQRATRFGNIVHTLNHVYVIDDIFKAHLSGVKHNYQARNTQTHPALEELWKMQKDIDQWYIDFAKSISEQELSEIVKFKFVDGAQGQMSRADMIFHIVNHGTYHRGFVSDMMYQIPVTPPSNDLSVFLNQKQ
jgi:uncharacterized damage-inducible protein DinB